MEVIIDWIIGLSYNEDLWVVLNEISSVIIGMILLSLDNLLYYIYYRKTYNRFNTKDLKSFLIIVLVNYPVSCGLYQLLYCIFWLLPEPYNWIFLVTFRIPFLVFLALIVLLVRFIVYKYYLKLNKLDIFMLMFGVYFIGIIFYYSLFYSLCIIL